MRWAALAVVALATRVAAADPRVTDPESRARLTTARADIQAHAHALRFAEALAAAEAALAIGAATPDEVAELARAAGEASAALDDAGAAERWFTLWLELRPNDDLPAGSSPKLTEPLAAARARVGGPLRALALEKDGRTVINVERDAAVAVASIDIGDEHYAISPASPTIDVGPREGALSVSLRDRHGNELSFSPLGFAPPRVVKHRSFFRRPAPWIGASVATAALGGVFLWRRSVAKDDLADILAHSEDHTFEDAEAARSRAGTHGILATVSFAAAAGLAVTAAILAFRSDDEPVTVIPTPNGVAVVARW